MSDPAALNHSNENYDNMTAAEFEERLPDLFQTGGGKVSQDPRFAVFLQRNPDCAALVRDLETIAETAAKLFEPSAGEEPSEAVWKNISDKLKTESQSSDDPNNNLE